MNPGHELDALIAEKVMGIPRQWSEAASTWRPEALPRYSTDIAAAFEVAAKLEEQEFALQLWHSEKNDIPGWYAHFTGKYWISSGYEGEKGETAAHAICLAALTAKP